MNSPGGAGTLGKLLAYHHWATGCFFDALHGLPAEALDRPLGGSFGSARGLLSHMIGAEWLWVERWQGRSPSGLLDLSGCKTGDDFRAEWEAVRMAQHRFFQGLSATRLETSLAYTSLKGEVWAYPLGTIVLHVANHGTYHRGQLAHMLRQLGQAPPSTDYLIFLDETEEPRP